MEESNVSLKPTLGTYLRYAGVILSDIVAVYSLYQTFDTVLAVVLSVAVVILTVAAAWYNNSITKGACAADAMKDVLKDATTAESITGVWAQLRSAVHDVYEAIKADKEA